VIRRPLRPDDVDRAVAIYNHYVATSTATFHTDPLTPEEWLAAVTPSDDERHGVWALGDPLVGYLVVSPFKSRCAYADTAEVTIYLDPEHTGRGFGTKTTTFVDEHAREAGLHALLAVVCAENTASLALFTRAGYDEVARLREVGRKFGRLLDVVYLERLLSPQDDAPSS